MSDVAVIAVSSTRVRAASLASGALVVACLCLALLALSRVTAYLEQQPIEGVQVEIAPREIPSPTAQPRAPPAPRADMNPSAAPTETDIPVDRAMAARTLRCFSLRAGEPRPPECPPPTPQQLEAAGGEFPFERRRDPRALMTPAERHIEAFMDNGPCEGICIPIGPTPPPPSRSPQQICMDGGLGPCRPPPFRAEDVQRLPHTQ